MDMQKFSQTALVLEEIHNELKNLKQAVDNKKFALGQQRQSYKQNMAEKNLQLENFNKTTAAALQKVETVMEKIDRVLNEDGSSNNNN